MLKSYYEQFKEDIDKKEELFLKEMQKLQIRLQKQQKQLDEVNLDYEKFNLIGNKVYEHYALIEELLNSINTAAKEKGWEYVVQKAKEDPRLNKLIKNINYQNNEIELELE